MIEMTGQPFEEFFKANEGLSKEPSKKAQERRMDAMDEEWIAVAAHHTFDRGWVSLQSGSARKTGVMKAKPFPDQWKTPEYRVTFHDFQPLDKEAFLRLVIGVAGVEAVAKILTACMNEQDNNDDK